MYRDLFNMPGDLFLGSDKAIAQALGARHFRSAGKALRFAMEHAAPVSLRGALLRIGNTSYGPAEIRRLHAQLERLA